MVNHMVKIIVKSTILRNKITEMEDRAEVKPRAFLSLGDEGR